MKTLKIKYSAMTLAGAICMLLLFSSSLFAQVVMYSTSPVSIEQGKTDLKGHLEAIKYENKRIESFRAKYKADTKAGREAAAIADQKEITRSKGDLKMEEAYLKAEKDMIIDNHNLAISAQRKVVSHDKKMLARSKYILDKDLAAIDDKSDKDAQTVVQWEKNLARDKEALSHRRIEKNNDLIAINKEIKKQNGQPVTTLYAENALASTSNWLQK